MSNGRKDGRRVAPAHAAPGIHPGSCGCALCTRGPEWVNQWTRTRLAEHGWYAHVVLKGDDSTPLGFNAHTHALQESFGHPDFQIVMPLDVKTVTGIFENLVDRVKQGERFEPGVSADRIIGDGYRVGFAAARDPLPNRPVLRVVLPDKANCVERESMDRRYRFQYEGTLDDF